MIKKVKFVPKEKGGEKAEGKVKVQFLQNHLGKNNKFMEKKEKKYDYLKPIRYDNPVKCPICHDYIGDTNDFIPGLGENNFYLFCKKCGIRVYRY